ncbi:serum opacification factor [Streptococcus dysgalactiae]|uniref:serum opacification factor n=2 Tax=Streptococcus dysgalactiae TaxID=1334 RepID=UPI001C9DC614|nr:serum opacification factor [Streptococcus dysgalactiae]QZT27165.1 serum opacification factor [Streptococcus dysgalactiae]
MTNCKYKLRKLSVGLVSVGTMFMATTVMGEEVTQPTATEVTASPVAVESSNEKVDTTEAEEVHAFKDADSEAIDITTKVETEQTEEEQTSATTGSQEEDSAPQPKSRSKRSTDSASAEPQLMEVETISVDKEKSQLNIKDSNGTTKLIKNRDGKQRDIMDISRNVKVNQDGTLDVTVTVTPKQIDEGAEVIALLDVSKKMTEENFNTAKENIKKLVNTLTSNSTDSSSNYNSRNSVRLISFYRKVNDPISLTADNVDKELDNIWQEAKEDWDWGVDLQGAIHKAREIFNKDKEKKSGKRQHIVLFSQGEATFSYDIEEKSKKDTKRITESVESSNPLLPWPPVFSFTNQNADMIDAAKYVVELGKKLGVGGLDGLESNLKLAETSSGLLGVFTGSGSLTEYLTLKEYKTNNLSEKDFDYTNRIGEGYHHYSFSDRKTDQLPMKSFIEKELKNMFNVDESTWFGWVLNSLSLTEKYKETKQRALLKVLEYLFYKREYIYYNHNLSAQAEAKMARDEGIVFYSFDVTDPNRATKETKPNNHSKEYTEYLKKKEEEYKKTAKERNEKFDKYLKEMSEDKQFLSGSDNKDKFKDILSEITVTDTFDSNITLEQSSWKLKNNDKNKERSVTYTPKSTSNGLLSFFSTSPTKDTLTWKISKDELKNAFETEQPLTLTYKLKVNHDKIKEALSKARKKRSTSTEADNSLTENIISNKISYKINNKKGNDSKLEDVKLTYRKEMVPVPEVDGEVVKPQAPQLPKLPPVIEHGPNFDFTENTVNQLPLEHGHYEPDATVTLIEDTKPEKADTIIGGNVIDFTEDSIPDKQYTESGHNSTNESQEIIEDTKPESDTISIGGQSDPIEITEDTLSNQSGHSNDATIIEDTKAPDIIIGGQDDMVTITQDTQPGLSGQANNLVITEDTRKPELTISGQSESVEITEDTQPVLSGSNDGTVVEEDTHPKLQFHFDNEEPTPAINQAVTQPSLAKAEDKLPQTGDNDKLETFFTVTALTVIGTAGLLAKKRREDQID